MYFEKDYFEVIYILDFFVKKFFSKFSEEFKGNIVLDEINFLVFSIKETFKRRFF